MTKLQVDAHQKHVGMTRTRDSRHSETLLFGIYLVNGAWMLTKSVSA